MIVVNTLVILQIAYKAMRLKYLHYKAKREVKRQAKLEQQQLKKKRVDHPNQTPEEALGHGSTFGKEVSQKPDNDTRTEKSDDIVEKDGISSLIMKEQESKDLQSGMEIGLHQT